VGGRWRERVGEKEKRKDAADMVGARPTSHGRPEKDAKRTEELQKRMF